MAGLSLSVSSFTAELFWNEWASAGGTMEMVNLLCDDKHLMKRCAQAVDKRPWGDDAHGAVADDSFRGCSASGISVAKSNDFICKFGNAVGQSGFTLICQLIQNQHLMREFVNAIGRNDCTVVDMDLMPDAPGGLTYVEGSNIGSGLLDLGTSRWFLQTGGRLDVSLRVAASDKIEMRLDVVHASANLFWHLQRNPSHLPSHFDGIIVFAGSTYLDSDGKECVLAIDRRAGSGFRILRLDEPRPEGIGFIMIFV